MQHNYESEKYLLLRTLSLISYVAEVHRTAPMQAHV